MAIMNQDLTTLLSQNGRTVYWTYKVLDSNDIENDKKVNVKNATIQYTSLDDLKQSATVSIDGGDDIDFENDRLQIICNIKIKQGLYSYPIGIFLMAAPKDQLSCKVTREVHCYSKLKLLYDDKVEKPYRLSAGSDIRTAIIKLLGSHKFNLPNITKLINNDFESGIGTTKLSIINELLSLLGLTSLYVTGKGVYEAREYVLPADRNVEFNYTNKGCYNLKTEKELELNSFDIPNVFISYTSSDSSDGLNYTYENNNSESKTSIVSRNGRRVCETPVLVEANTMSELIEATKKRANEASTAYIKLKWSTKVNPLHGYLNCCYIADGRVDGKYIETSWIIDTSKDTMEHNGRRCIAV